jgi:hypothetical protein
MTSRKYWVVTCDYCGAQETTDKKWQLYDVRRDPDTWYRLPRWVRKDGKDRCPACYIEPTHPKAKYDRNRLIAAARWRDKLSYAEIGRRFQLSGSRVSQIVYKEKMRALSIYGTYDQVDRVLELYDIRKEDLREPFGHIYEEEIK